MIFFAIVFYLVGVLLIIVGGAIWKGKTGLIHEYHRRNVTDHRNYGRAMGKVIGGMGLSSCLCATLSFFGEAETGMIIGTIVFFIGFIVMFVCAIFVQRKYNGGMFS